MTASMAQLPPSHDAPGEWRARLDAHAEAHGFHAQLSPAHGVLFTEEDDSLLLVSFENAATIRASESRLPFGLSVAGREGWSQLCFYSEGDTWFRDPEVFAFLDDLVDDGFFDHFGQVLFYGAGAGGYAAAVFSVAAPGAGVLAIRPQATLDPGLAGWDDRHRRMRRTDFTARYGYGPEMIEGAESCIVVFDPDEHLDAAHAALYARPNTLFLRTRHLGPETEDELDAMKILVPMIRAAGRGRLDGPLFAELYRRRHRHLPYLRRVLDRLEARDRPLLVALWCRAVSTFTRRPRFQAAQSAAEENLRAAGRPLPPPRLPVPRTAGSD